VFKVGAKAADLAVDLGTSFTRIADPSGRILIEAPTVVATQVGSRGRQVVAVGTEAKKMIGRTPAGIEVVRPVRGGVVADFEATEHLLRHLLKQVGGRSLRRPRLLVCVPTNTSEVERRAVQESARAAGSREIFLVGTAMAGAIGAELPVSEPVGSLIVDSGGGRTEVAILSLGGLVVHRSIEIAGDNLDDAITDWLRRTHNLLIGERTAQNLKHHIGGAASDEEHQQMRIRGRDLAGGAPREVEITTADIAAAISDGVQNIRAVVRAALDETSPELSADIIDRGMMLCGGTSHLRGLDRLLREDTGLPVLQPEDPSRCVVRGAGILLRDAALFERVVATS
jgi:rod shape-determining protein MreB